MKKVLFASVLFLLCAAMNSCGPVASHASPLTASDSPKYQIGQYVYIHGEIKAIVKDNHYNQGCGCGQGGKKHYKVVVAGGDGSAHQWYVDDDELSPTHDTVVVRYVSTDSLTSVLTRTIRDNFNQQLESEKEIKQQIKDALTKDK